MTSSWKRYFILEKPTVSLEWRNQLDNEILLENQHAISITKKVLEF